jgi:hypothetical protein
MLARGGKGLEWESRVAIDFGRVLRCRCGDQSRPHAWRLRANGSGTGYIESLYARLLVEGLYPIDCAVARVPKVRQDI